MWLEFNFILATFRFGRYRFKPVLAASLERLTVSSPLYFTEPRRSLPSLPAAGPFLNICRLAAGSRRSTPAFRDRSLFVSATLRFVSAASTNVVLVLPRSRRAAMVPNQ